MKITCPHCGGEIGGGEEMTQCKHCGSFAINPGHHGRREGVDLDLCDVCYWRSRMERIEKAAKDLLNAVTVLCGDEYSCFSTCSLAKECDKDVCENPELVKEST